MGMLRLGEAIKFGTEGNSGDFIGSGWSSLQDSPSATWTTDHVATLNIRLAAGAPRIKLLVEAEPFLADNKITHQEANIYINGLWAAFVRAEAYSQTAHVFSGDLLNAVGNNIIAFVMPTARVPAKMGIGSDERCLGFAFQTVTLERG